MLGEDRGGDGRGSAVEASGAQGLEDAETHQDLQGGRQRQTDHGHEVSSRAEQVDHPEAEAVGEGAGAQGEAGAGGNENDDHPLDGGEVGLEGVAHGGQADVDGEVQGGQDHAQGGGGRQQQGAPRDPTGHRRRVGVGLGAHGG